MPRQHRRTCLAKILRQFYEQEAAPRAKVYYLAVKRAPERAVQELRRHLNPPPAKNLDK